MRFVIALAALLTFLPPVTTAQDCVPTSQDPSTYTIVYSAEGSVYYLLRSSSLSGVGTLYEETNGIFDYPGGSLQRGGVGYLGDCFPYPVCLVVDWDHIEDETCGYGPDSLIY